MGIPAGDIHGEGGVGVFVLSKKRPVTRHGVTRPGKELAARAAPLVRLLDDPADPRLHVRNHRPDTGAGNVCSR